MKEFFKIIITTIIVGLIGAIGMWGVITNESDTELGWRIWGWLLAMVIIVIPTASFWTKQVGKVIDLDV
jgi:hypothetical protein